MPGRRARPAAAPAAPVRVAAAGRGRRGKLSPDAPRGAPGEVFGSCRIACGINILHAILALEAGQRNSYTPALLFTEVRGDRCVRRFRQIIVRPTMKSL